MKVVFIFLFMSILVFVSHSQVPGEEFRGSWLTTVYNIDWPSTKNNTEAQKQEFKEIIAKAVSTNMNAIFLQVRPNADAFYNSEYEPWSEWLTGERGKDPGYDPLEFAISEAHKNGIELHAWLNPYRLEISSGDYIGEPGDFATSNPEWILDVAGRTYFNPGIPEVTKHITNIVGDIIGKYDLDGLCFDDYFYPSEIVIEDQVAFTDYGNGLSIRDFRRASVNNMIATVHDTIKVIKPFIRFGVSPAGIYSTDPSAATSHNTILPSGISGRDNYNVIYCDPLAWMEAGSIDYLSPQLYWQIGGGQDFHKLTDWWEVECRKHNVQFFPSLATYRLSTQQPPGNADEGWELNEIINQIQYLRNNTEDKGMVFFSNSDLEDIEKFSDLLQTQVFDDLVIWPEFGSSTIPSQPRELEIYRIASEPISSVFWSSNDGNRFLVEGLSNAQESTVKKISYRKDFPLPLDTITEKFKIHTINKYGKINTEFSPLTVPPVDSPEIISFEGDEISSDNTLAWNYAKNSSGYILSVSENEIFSTELFNSGLIRDTFIQIEDLILEGSRTYFWKVLACNGNGCKESIKDEFFTGFPIASEIISPINGELHVSLFAEIRWEIIEGADSYEVQVSKDSLFNTISQEGILETNELPFITDELEKWSDFYVRVRGLNNSGKGQWSATSTFKTTTDIPLAPDFLFPENLAEIGSENIEISWSKVDIASGYKLTIALDEEFEEVLLDSSFSQYKREYNYEIPEKDEYFLRLCSEYIGGCGDWSSTVQFTSISSSVDEINTVKLKISPNPVVDQLFVSNLSGTLNQSGFSLLIFNSMGQKVLQKTIVSSQDTEVLNVFDLNKGVYFLRLVDDKGNIKGLGNFVKL